MDNLKDFEKILRNKIGSSLKKPISARLGYMNNNGEIFLKIPESRNDQPNKYYFHEGAGIGFQGEAFLQSGALQKWQIRYGTPIRIKQDPLTDEWEIIGLDTKYADRFFEGVSQDEPNILNYKNIGMGLLIANEPANMFCRVLGGFYNLPESVYINTQSTVDWSSVPHNTNIPTNHLESRCVLVQIDSSTLSLTYKYGQIFPTHFNFSRLLEVDDNSGIFLPKEDDDCIRVGYIKLISGMTNITNELILPAQSYLVTKSVGQTNENYGILDKILVDKVTGEVVVDKITGTVVYTE
jgi:hypothetical protein